MAEKTKASRAESKVTDAKKKSSAAGSASKSKTSAKKSDAGKKEIKKTPENEGAIPSSFVTAMAPQDIMPDNTKMR